MNAADQGSVLDRSRLFTLAVTKELYDKSTKDKEFKWPEKKPINKSKCIKDIFREPVDPSHLASPHVMEGFIEKVYETPTGVKYRYTKGHGIGDWYNANAVISEQGKGLSITAMGNSRWIEFVDIDGETRWRRLSGVETARAFGMTEEQLKRFQHLSDPEIHAAVGNGVCIEMGEAMGKVVKQFWDPEWFQAQCAAKAGETEDMFCIHGGTINLQNETERSEIINRMSEEDNVEVQNIIKRGQAAAENKKEDALRTVVNRLDAGTGNESAKNGKKESRCIKKVCTGEHTQGEGKAQ